VCFLRRRWTCPLWWARSKKFAGRPLSHDIGWAETTFVIPSEKSKSFAFTKPSNLYLVPDDSWCILSIPCCFYRFDLAHFVFVLSHGLQVEVSSSLKLDTWSRAHLDQIWKDQGAGLRDRESVCRALHGFSFQTQATEWEHDQEWLCHSAGGVWWKQICWDSKTWIAFEPWNTIMKSYLFLSRRPIPMNSW